MNGSGQVVAWNGAAEAIFDLIADQAIGKACGEIIQGMDECGPVCSANCSVQQAVRKHHPIGNFDLQIKTASGKQWCNVSVLIASEATSTMPYSIHIVRQIDVRKRLELPVRDFVVTGTGMPAEQAATLISSARGPLGRWSLGKRDANIWVKKMAPPVAIRRSHAASSICLICDSSTAFCRRVLTTSVALPL